MSLLVGVGSALGVAPPGSDPKGDAAGAVKDAAKSPGARATAGYYSTRLASALLSKAGAVELGTVVGERVVPIVGWIATAYTVVSAAKEGASYYQENSDSCH